MYTRDEYNEEILEKASVLFEQEMASADHNPGGEHPQLAELVGRAYAHQELGELALLDAAVDQLRRLLITGGIPADTLPDQVWRLSPTPDAPVDYDMLAGEIESLASSVQEDLSRWLGVLDTTADPAARHEALTELRLALNLAAEMAPLPELPPHAA